MFFNANPSFFLKHKKSISVPFSSGDICDPNPCENGGICLSGLADDSYSCECPDGFTDPNCSSVVEVDRNMPQPGWLGKLTRA
uniref:EGF-like domain-containing protein n=1 Tax=Spermophilus dauricus TaxID=99837 RepID=A0A8C9PKY0_SPEDA